MTVLQWTVTVGRGRPNPRLMQFETEPAAYAAAVDHASMTRPAIVTHPNGHEFVLWRTPVDAVQASLAPAEPAEVDRGLTAVADLIRKANAGAQLFYALYDTRADVAPALFAMLSRAQTSAYRNARAAFGVNGSTEETTVATTQPRPPTPSGPPEPAGPARDPKDLPRPAEPDRRERE